MDVLRALLGSPELTTLILGAFTSIVVAVVGRLAYQARLSLVAHLSASEFALLKSIAATAVQFTEQKFSDLGGPAKLEQALTAANVQIAAFGIKVTADQLLRIIEAAVYTETAKPVFLPETLPALVGVIPPAA